jgi:hypothetical protein
MKKKNQYEIEVVFTFNSKVFVNANNAEEARKIVEKDFNVTLVDTIETTLSRETMPDYSVPFHPEKTIGTIQRVINPIS